MDLGVLPAKLRENLIAMLANPAPRLGQTLGPALRHGRLNNFGELEGDDVIILGEPDLEHATTLTGIYEHLASQFKVEQDLSAWLERCTMDGQLLASYAVGRHNDDGVGEQSDRLLVVLQSPGLYRFETYGDGDVITCNVVLQDGHLVLFNESLDHRLVMEGADHLLNTDRFQDSVTGTLAADQLIFMMNVPSPVINGRSFG